MGGGGGSSKPDIIPFNMAELAPFMPSVFNGPYNAQGAFQNERMLASKYPWIAPPAGQFAGAQPGQFAGAGQPINNGGAYGGGGGTGNTPYAVQPPIPPTVINAANAPYMNNAAFNQMGLASNQMNGMQVNPMQSVVAALQGQSNAPTGGST